MSDDHALHDALPHIWAGHIDEILDYLDAHPEHVPDEARAIIKADALAGWLQESKSAPTIRAHPEAQS